MKRSYSVLLSGLLALGLAAPACSTDSGGDDDEVLGIGLLAAAFASRISVAEEQRDGFCNVTFGTRTISNAPLTTLEQNSTDTATLSFTSSTTRNWSAISVPSAQDGTTITFDFNPAYRPPFGYDADISLAYITNECPITSSTPTDYNVNDALNAPIDPTNYAFNTTSFTFNNNAQGQNFFIIAAPALTQTTGTVTRSDP